MMVLALGLRRAKEADHATRVKGRCSATQGAFCQTGLLRPFSRSNAVQDDEANLFIEPLFWCATPLNQQMIRVGAFSPLSLRLWHSHPPLGREKGKSIRIEDP